MKKNRSTKKNKNTSAWKPSMVWLSILLVTVSFIGGTIFSSFRLAGDSSPVKPSAGASQSINLDGLKARALENKDSVKAWEELLAVNPIATFGSGQSVDSVVWEYKQKGQK